MAFAGGRVHSLKNIAIYSVVGHVSMYGTKVQHLPMNVKNRIIHLLCKRGLLDDTNLPKFLDSTHEVLGLSECIITDKSLLSISEVCTRLLKIDLNSPTGARKGPTSKGIKMCAERCRFLRIVFLRRCENICDEGVIAIAVNCKFLQQLNISGCVLVGDESLKALAMWSTQLAHFNFSGTSVTDLGVIVLAGGVCSKKLKEMHMSNCKSITDESVEAVVSSCPNLEVLIFHGCPNMTSRAQTLLEENLLRRDKIKHLTWTIY